jgi:uncharacterized protein
MPDWLELLARPSALELAVVAAASFLAGFLRGFVGFGAALITVPVLSAVFGPIAAVPIASLIGLPALFQLLPDAIRFAERVIVVPIAFATFAAAPLGAWILVSVDPGAMKMAISTLVLAMVVMLHRGWRLTAEPGLGVLLGAGATAGLVQGSAGVGGPPVVAVALARPGDPAQQRANVVGVMTAIPLSSLLPLWYFGLFTRSVVVVSLVLIPLYSGATWLGARYFSLGGQRHFRNAALLALAVIGLATFALAVRDRVTG